MMDDDDQEELHCTGSDVEIEEYTDTEETPYAAYQPPDKLFDTDQPEWQKFGFLGTLTVVVTSVTMLVIAFPLYLESVSAVSTAYTGTYNLYIPGRLPYVHTRCAYIHHGLSSTFRKEKKKKKTTCILTNVTYVNGITSAHFFKLH